MRRTLIAWTLAVWIVPQICEAAWDITMPMANESRSQSMSVSGSGTGEGDACSLYFRVHRDGDYKNDGTGSWPGGLAGIWSGSVAPPTGGFGAGDGLLKMWKAGEPITSNSLDTQNFTFTNP